MNSVRSQLHNDPDALLLMQAAGELPAEDERMVLAMLANDGELRRRYEAMRAHLDGLDQRFSAADACSSLRTEHAMRRAVEAIRDWQLGRASAPANVGRPAEPMARRWGWPSAAAAVLALGLGAAAIVTYLRNDLPRSAVHAEDDLPPAPADSDDNPLALHAATSLAAGPEVEDDAPPPSPMPPTASDPIVQSEQPFFDIPVIADADGH